MIWFSFLGEEEEQPEARWIEISRERERTLAQLGFRVKRLRLAGFGPSDSFRVPQEIMIPTCSGPGPVA